MGWKTAKERECPHCEDGHEDPNRAHWGAYVDVHKDGDGQPTILAVMKTGSQHVAECDAEWVRERLMGVDALQPAEVLDGLDKLAEELGEQLPGLAAVAEVLRGQVAEALLKKTNEPKFAKGGILPGGGLVGGTATGRTTTPSQMIQIMGEARSKDEAMSAAERALKKREAMRRRGINT